MKPTRFTLLFVSGLIALLAATGCKTKTPPLTDVNKGHGVTGSGDNPDPGAGNKLAGTGSGAGVSSGGIPANPAGAHAGWIPHPDILQADTVRFDFDSAVINPGEQSKVAAVADYLKSNASDAVNIEGHCDERGTEEYNRALGDRRAQALREELAKLGIDATRVDTVSFGKDRPADPGHDETAWKQNRRGVFIVLTPPK
jgi:peptidoglycan-associated lipoprotein